MIQSVTTRFVFVTKHSVTKVERNKIRIRKSPFGFSSRSLCTSVFYIILINNLPFLKG